MQKNRTLPHAGNLFGQLFNKVYVTKLLNNINYNFFNAEPPCYILVYDTVYWYNLKHLSNHFHISRLHLAYPCQSLTTVELKVQEFQKNQKKYQKVNCLIMVKKTEPQQDVIYSFQEQNIMFHIQFVFYLCCGFVKFKSIVLTFKFCLQFSLIYGAIPN